MLYYSKTINLGKMDTGYKRLANVTATIKLRMIEKEQDTVDHTRVRPASSITALSPNKYPALRLSIIGDAKRPRAKDTDTCGQIYDGLEELQPNMDRYKLAQFIAIWKHWHLNDLTAGCVHQDEIGVNAEDWTAQADAQTNKCPKGYKYGSQWLFKPLPTAVVDFLLSL